MLEPKGQILPGSDFGDLLTELAKQSERILEIGTWHGQGSTLCLSKGLVRPTQRLWTVDQSAEMWREARAYYPREHRMRFLCAHTIDILDELPDTLDLVLFDGHDEQTDNEFDLLLPMLSRFVALDDTNVRKNMRQVKLLTEWSWKVLRVGVPGVRHGWAVFEKP